MLEFRPEVHDFEFGHFKVLRGLAAGMGLPEGPMNELEPFESSRVLINGARDDIDILEEGCEFFVKRCTYSLVRYREPSSGDEVLKYRFDQRMPDRLRRLVGHVIGDCRHALDHAFCDAAALLDHPNPRRASFPFGGSPAELDAEIKKLGRRAPAELLAYAKALRPYPGGDDLLHKLNDLANGSKHRVIARMSLDQSAMTIVAAHLTEIGGPVSFGNLGWNTLRNEITIGRAGPGGYFGPGVKDYFKPELQVVLGDGEPPVAGPAPAKLREIANKVEGIVSGLEAEVGRLIAAKP